MPRSTIFYADATCYAAVLFVMVALVVCIPSALLRWMGTDGARFGVFVACVVFGAAYGAAFGSFYGPALWRPAAEGALGAVLSGATYGVLLGAFGGGVAGFFGNVIGGPVGWWLAGVLGSAAPAACVWIVSCMAAGWEPVYPKQILTDGLLACSDIVCIGSFLGIALSRCLRTGRSIVPGVQRLAAMIHGVNGPEHVP